MMEAPALLPHTAAIQLSAIASCSLPHTRHPFKMCATPLERRRWGRNRGKTRRGGGGQAGGGGEEDKFSHAASRPQTRTVGARSSCGDITVHQLQ